MSVNVFLPLGKFIGLSPYSVTFFTPFLHHTPMSPVTSLSSSFSESRCHTKVGSEKGPAPPGGLIWTGTKARKCWGKLGSIPQTREASRIPGIPLIVLALGDKALKLRGYRSQSVSSLERSWEISWASVWTEAQYGTETKIFTCGGSWAGIWAQTPYAIIPHQAILVPTVAFL